MNDNMVRIGFIVEKELHDKIKIKCIRKKISMTDLYILLMNDWLKEK